MDKNDLIRDLAIIGDRRTAALLDRRSDLLWYCPGRFDNPSLFAALIDPEGGSWRIRGHARPLGRAYLGDSAILQTVLAVDGGEMTITDFMTAGTGAPTGLLCRLFSAPPHDVEFVVEPRPDYARRPVRLERSGDAVVIDDRQHLYASAPLAIADDGVTCTLPKGREGWAILADNKMAEPGRIDIEGWLEATLEHWRRLSSRSSYAGPYEREVRQSLRALRLLTHDASGGVIAAATTSLPEVPGGSANWDYRFVWLRDAGMIVSALTRLDSDFSEGGRYLDFICSSRGVSLDYPVPVFTTLDQKLAPEEEVLDLAGHLGSRPVRVGNDARDQLQLDAFGNVLLAAKLIYQRTEERPHWVTVEEIAEFLVEHWRDPDHGIWEETAKLQYTASKVIAACALDSIAEYSQDEGQARRWRETVQDIRDFVARRCLTSSGAFAVAAGSEQIDVSAALFPIWAFVAADAPEMLATMAELEREWSWEGLLYWRRLQNADSSKEGAFLAGTFWVAQYWVMRGDLHRSRRILDAALRYANDLGLFAEEADPRQQRMLGNFPQAFVHAAFMGAVIDLRTALQAQSDHAKEE
ncbi:MAG TPA: glycoside hydrolase family 15 protein [Devosiaceae bacterium]|jgi:GH15 family glucan-1,4-alpha-glucosidase|nr:glycoside hydrolase family 15 protein [Devosiaceae bacterium]